MFSYDIYHETVAENFFKIFESGQLMIKSHSEKIGGKSVQGSKSRRLATDPKITLKDPGFFTEFDEVDACYFRFKKSTQQFKNINRKSDCVLVFDENLVKDHVTVINTEENFGFMIGENGEMGNSQFSDEPGVSFFDPRTMEVVDYVDFFPECTEIACLENVDINKYCKKIGFIDPDLYEKYKNILKIEIFLI